MSDESALSICEDSVREFTELLAKDTQIRYAQNAIRRYKSSEAVDVDDERKSRHKRNIISVDDNLKINYEMVKMTPGTFIESSVSTSKNKALKEKAGKVTKMKTNYYKKRLYNMNEQFLAEQGTLEPVSCSDSQSPESAADAGDAGDTAGAASIADDAPLDQQARWLAEIHKDLLQQYNTLLQEEKKWFLKKEVLLDANAKLDLFTTRDEDQSTLQLGSKDTAGLCMFH